MFRTPVSLAPVDQPITLSSKTLSIGSCFADFIGGRLIRNKFQIISNPLGIIFHPLAQLRIIELALSSKAPPSNTYVCSQGIWYNYWFHGSISHSSLAGLEKLIQQRLDQMRVQLDCLDVLLITFGTAIEYKHIETNYLVANCHKVPQKEFIKSQSTPINIVESFQSLWSSWKAPKPTLILSVSPIRHIKEGLTQNTTSKATLCLACQQIIKLFPEIHYFPGFEIMMDDLRDYRFYQKDMIHPNQTARDYIWDLFTENYLDPEARSFLAQWGKISRNLDHRPFHPHTPSHQEFIKKTLSLIEQLPKGIDTSKEKAMLKKELQ